MERNSKKRKVEIKEVDFSSVIIFTNVESRSIGHYRCVSCISRLQFDFFNKFNPKFIVTNGDREVVVYWKHPLMNTYQLCADIEIDHAKVSTIQNTIPHFFWEDFAESWMDEEDDKCDGLKNYILYDAWRRNVGKMDREEITEYVENGYPNLTNDTIQARIRGQDDRLH